MRARVTGYTGLRCLSQYHVSDGTGSANNNTPDSFFILKLLRGYYQCADLVLPACWVNNLKYAISAQRNIRVL